MRLTWLLTNVALLGLLIVGCGGSGSSSDSSTNSGMQVFATDDLNTGFDHVWVTIDKIDLAGASGATTVFDDTTNGGKVVDLRTLHDATGAKFLLLAGCTTPAGTYTGVNVTVSPNLTVMPMGAKSSTAATFANASGKSFVLALTFATPQTISASDKVVVDFDLANWTLTGTTVSATNNQFLAQGPTTGLADGTRQCASVYDGTVSALIGTAPSQIFTLTRGKNTISVSLSDTTTFMNSDGTSNPVLANGNQVEVDGTFDSANNVLNATSITIHVGTAKPEPARVAGLVTGIDPKANTVTLQVQGCDGFQPSANSITLSLSSTTMYFDGSGVTDTEAQFLGELVANKTEVFANGTIAGTTLTAKNVTISSRGGSAHVVAVKGVAANPSATGGTFDVTLANWEGGRLKAGTVVHVVTSTTTIFSDAGAPETQAGFFTALTPTSLVQVRGTVDLTTMTVTAAAVGSGLDNRFHF